MKALLAILLSLLFCFFSVSAIKAQVVLNEFSSNSDPEWVELYNTSSNPIDLTGWKVQDSVQAPKLITGSIEAYGYFVFENPVGWLNNTGGDSITLKDLGDVIINSIQYGSGGVVSIPDSDKSAGRVPNNSESWQNNLVWTKGMVNPDPTPVPTLTTTPTQAPTSNPTATTVPTPASTKTSTPIPTKTATPKPSASPSLKPTDTPEPEVMGVTTEPSPSPTQALEEKDDQKKLPFLPIIFIGSGVLMVGFAVYNLIRAKSLPVQN